MKKILILSFTLIAAVLVGCASNETAVSNSNDSRQIVDITIIETPDSLVLEIRGNQKLIHSEEEQASADEIIFYFPDTYLEGVKGHFIPPNNDLISYIKTDQYRENETTNSAVYVKLKIETPYNVTPDTKRLKITFSRSSMPPLQLEPQKKLAKIEPKPQPVQNNIPVATILSAVTTKSLNDTVTVNITADGAIKDYKDFTMKNPGRIVFDLYNIKSPHHTEQKIEVQSRWIKRIRYFGHPDKLRLVIETLDKSVSNYSSVPTNDGLIIHVGKND